MNRERPAPSTLARAALALAALRLVLQLAARAAFDGWTFVLSPTEVVRTLAAVSFAAKPAFAPDGILYWLPLPFWLTGSLLKLWPDPLLVPFALNTLFSLLTVAGLTLWAGELAGTGAAVCAGLAAALNGGLLTLGIGASADPLLHAALVWGLLFWHRLERGGRSRDAWASGLCLAAACAARYEAWFVLAGLCAAAAWERRRAALPALALACAVPAAWLLFNRVFAGDALAFARITLEADLRDHSLSALQRGLGTLIDSFEELPAWLLALAGASALGAARLPRSYWLSIASLTALFVGSQPWNDATVDLHLLTLFVLLSPAAGAAAASALGALSPGRRRLGAAAAALLLLAASSSRLMATHITYRRRLSAVARPYLAVRRAADAGRLGAEGTVLVELPAEGRLIAYHKAWELEPRLRAFLDRPFPPNDAGGRYPQPDGPSPLEQPAPALSAWLGARNVAVAVASRRTASLAAAGWRADGDGLWWPPAPAAR